MTRATLDDFESVLLAELRAHVIERAASARSQRPVGRRLATMAAAAAAVGIAAAGVIGLRPDPAFAVERQTDGDIVVTVIELSDADGLERALAKEGITAEVTYDASAAKPSDLDTGEGALDCAPAGLVVDPADGGGVTFKLDAEYVAAHDSVLRLTAAGGRTADDWIAATVRWEGVAC